MAVKEYQYKNAIIKIKRPELSDTERERREKQIVIALQQFGKEMVETAGKEVG